MRRHVKKRTNPYTVTLSLKVNKNKNAYNYLKKSSLKRHVPSNMGIHVEFLSEKINNIWHFILLYHNFDLTALTMASGVIN